MELADHWDYILETARQRLANNKTEWQVEDYGTQLEVRGAAGELAARLILGLEPVLHTHFDDGIDFFYAQKSIDVKSTKLVKSLEHRFLQWPTFKKPKADIILSVAVHLTQKRATILGYATRHEIMDAPVNPERPQPCHEILYSSLHPLWELVADQSYVDWVKGGRLEEQKNPI